MELNLIKEQIDIFLEIQNAGFNIVNCGMCGEVILKRLEDEGVRCHKCLEELDDADCPDLWYE